MRVLGVDPGLTRCGMGVVDIAKTRTASLIAVDVVGSGPDLPLAERLLVVGKSIEEWLDRYEPEVLAVERLFSQENRSTVMGVAQVSGVVMVAAARRGIPVVLHTPTEVKAAVTGDGRAEKAAVATMVQRILKLSKPPQPADAADALALAITHGWRGAGAQTTSNSGDLTPAQRLWQQAEVSAKHQGKKSKHNWR